MEYKEPLLRSVQLAFNGIIHEISNGVIDFDSKTGIPMYLCMQTGGYLLEHIPFTVLINNSCLLKFLLFKC